MKRYLNSLHIPETFRITCIIYHFPVYRVLQDFIDHISVYDALHHTAHQAYHLATSTALNFACTARRGTGEAFDHHREHGLKHLTALIRLGMQSRMTENRKRKLSRLIIRELYSVIKPDKNRSAPIYLCEDTILYFTLDFCIFCELHSCYPTEILEYFMETANLSTMPGERSFQSAQQHPASGFFATFLQRQQRTRQTQQNNGSVMEGQSQAGKISPG